jgi:anti-sigma regulatory factor (Ser/Thr protein kinase)
VQYELVNVGTQAAFVEARSTWAADLVHLPHIRALTRQWLGALGFDQNTEQDLVFAVNEAASNAIEHAYPNPGPGDQVTVSFWTEPRHLNVEVADRGRWRQPDADCGHRGRGILIMQQMVESMSIHKNPDGTRVRLRHPTARQRPLL